MIKSYHILEALHIYLLHGICLYTFGLFLRLLYSVAT